MSVGRRRELVRMAFVYLERDSDGREDERT
jgi:hypothetical protein